MIFFDKKDIYYVSDNFEKQLIKSKDLKRYFREKIVLSKHFTVEDLFLILNENLAEMNSIFKCYLGGFDLKDFVTDALHKPTRDRNYESVIESANGIGHFSVFWSLYDEWYSIKEAEKEINIDSLEDIDARWKENETSDPQEDFNKIMENIENNNVSGNMVTVSNYAKKLVYYILFRGVEYNSSGGKEFVHYIGPLYYIKDKVLKIDPYRELSSFNVNGTKYLHDTSVFEFLSGILWEVSWYGCPRDRDEFFDTLSKECED